MRIFLIIAAVVALIGVIVGSVIYATSDERAMARQFVFDLTSGAYEDAAAVMHPALLEEIPLDSLNEMFAPIATYSTVRFTAFETANGQTTLQGQATTEGGCASEVDFTITDDQISAFFFRPPCPKE